jgi:hypothetical protein
MSVDQDLPNDLRSDNGAAEGREVNRIALFELFLSEPFCASGW